MVLTEISMKWTYKYLLFISILLVMQFNQQLSGQELILYIVPPPAEISWESPRDLMRTTLFNQFRRSIRQTTYPLGHLYIGLIHEENGIEIWTGMTREHLNTAGQKVMREGYGMGILFADIEGRLQETEEIIQSIEKIEQFGESSFLRFAVSEETFLRLTGYLKEYTKRNYGDIYNGLNRPREGLGAGCAAFGESFLQLAGIPYEQWLSDWSAEIRIPENLTGGNRFKRHVTITRQLLTVKWASKDEPHYLFSVMDPFIMHHWVIEKWNSDEEDILWKKEKRSKSKGLFWDFSHLPTPKESIFIK
jgi:hypothetical protein